MNINNMGIFISELRREANMTQVELADILHVSHQAVSKWERLESLPDITMLPILAETFNMTVDELLKGKREVGAEKSEDKTKVEAFVEDIVNAKLDEAKEALKGLENMQDILGGIAPITKPKIFEKIISAVDINLEDISSFLPFLGSETLDKIVNKIIQEGDLNKIQVTLYPFLKITQKDALIDYYVSEEKEWNNIEMIYPFLNSEQHKRLIAYFILKAMKKELENLNPFLTEEVRNLLVDEMVKREKYELVENLIPFLNSVQRDKINKVIV